VLAVVSARQLCSAGGSVVLEAADQLGGGVAGGYLAGQPDVDLDRGMVIRANVNDVGPAEDHQPDRLSDQQAEQLERAAGAERPDGIKRVQPPWPALIDADDSSAVARPPARRIRELAAAAEPLQATARCRRRSAVRTAHLLCGV